MSENWTKEKGSANPILNMIGNICGKLSHILMKPQIRWGTMWTLEFSEDIDKENIDI